MNTKIGIIHRVSNFTIGKQAFREGKISSLIEFRDELEMKKFGHCNPRLRTCK